MSFIKHFLLALGAVTIVTGGLLTSTASVLACSCVMMTPQEQLEKADSVFIGRATDISGTGQKRLVDFAVSDVRKGAAMNNAIVQTGQGGGDCGFEFETGKEYTVYAYAEDSTLFTSMCSGTSLTSVDRAVIDDNDGATSFEKPTNQPAPAKTTERSVISMIILAALITGLGLVLAYRNNRKP